MRRGWFCALVLVWALGGCAGLRQFPEKVEGSDAEVLAHLDATYDKALKDIYDPNNSSNQREIRNQFIERRLAVLDVQFQDFVRDLARDNANADLLVALAGVGTGGAGALVSKTASQILSAVSGGLAGGKAAYDKAVLYDNAITALIAQMAAGRQKVAARIFTRWQYNVEDYPLWLARQDIDAYELAGSLPGAIIATAEDAKDKAEQAEDVLRVRLPDLTDEAVSPPVVQGRQRLDERVAALSAKNATLLVIQLEKEFPALKPAVQVLYSDEERTGDGDEVAAKQALGFLINSTAKTMAGLAIWDRAFQTLPPS